MVTGDDAAQADAEKLHALLERLEGLTESVRTRLDASPDNGDAVIKELGTAQSALLAADPRRRAFSVPSFWLSAGGWVPKALFANLAAELFARQLLPRPAGGAQACRPEQGRSDAHSPCN